MANIHINIGSNQNRQHNILSAIKELQSTFSNITLSALFESPAEGFKGDYFYNVGVNAVTDMSIASMIDVLKEIEMKNNRHKNKFKFSNRTIDLDLVLVDNVINPKHNLPRDDILKYAFVLAPLANLNPDLVHPFENKTYQHLWQTFKINNQFQLMQYNINTLTK